MEPSKFIAYGEIDAEGKASAYDKRVVHDFCKMHPNSRLEITYKIIKDKGTEAQRGYYWGVVVPNVQMGLRDLGVTMGGEKVHDMLRQRSTVGVVAVPIKEQVFSAILSTSSFSKEDWMMYIDECIQFAAEELSVVVPEPILERISIDKR